ncbi:hypothetical protein ACFL1P_01340 [Patescibacteria group bacterium]
MPIKKKRKRILPTNQYTISGPSLIITFIVIFLLGFLFIKFGKGDLHTFILSWSSVGAKGRNGHDIGCDEVSTRPCFDKMTGKKVQLMGKNAEKAFSACMKNSAPNKSGEVVHETTVCEKEISLYCYEGVSSVYMRKFEGECDIPPPEPTAIPTPDPTTVPPPPLNIITPDGTEQWPYGSTQQITWEGGIASHDWPIYISIISPDRTRTLRELIVTTDNDGIEPWVVDLPIGKYVLFVQGCRGCESGTQWDYSTTSFDVIEGSPVQKVHSLYPANMGLVVLSPGGSETWKKDSSQTIRWSGGESDWKLSLYVYGNNSYTTVANGLENDGMHEWVVPVYIPPGSYTLYAGCENCSQTSGNYAYSFYPFIIE